MCGTLIGVIWRRSGVPPIVNTSVLAYLAREGWEVGVQLLHPGALHSVGAPVVIVAAKLSN